MALVCRSLALPSLVVEVRIIKRNRSEAVVRRGGQVPRLLLLHLSNTASRSKNFKNIITAFDGHSAARLYLPTSSTAMVAGCTPK